MINFEERLPEERLAEAVLLTQKLREESFDQKEADKHTGQIFDYNTCYKLSMYDAADKAAEKLGFDKSMTQPIYLLCKLAWNDIQDWAKIHSK